MRVSGVAVLKMVELSPSSDYNTCSSASNDDEIKGCIGKRCRVYKHCGRDVDAEE